MRRMLRTASCLATLISFTLLAAEEKPKEQTDYSLTQQLVIASFNLDVDQVRKLLESNADVNGEIGSHDKHLFQDKWSLGWPMGSSKWTPLLAAANSFTKPQPKLKNENTSEAQNRARIEREAIPQIEVEKRNRRRLEIIKLLVKAGSDLDADDGHGATALYTTIRKKTLIQRNI